MKQLFLALIALGSIACSSTKGIYEFDPSVDFSSYKTFAFTNETANVGVKTLTRKKILKAIEVEMREQGFTQSKNPDVLIDVVSTTKEDVKTSKTTVSNPWHFGGWAGFEGNYTYNNTQTEGSIIVTMVNNASQKMVWYGMGSTHIKEEASTRQKTAYIEQTVKKIFKKYPPKK